MWPGFSVFPTDVNLRASPALWFLPMQKAKKGKLKMKLQIQGNFNSFKSYNFKKNSAYTPGGRQQDRKISRMKIIPVEKQGGDQVPFLPPISLLTPWIWRPSPLNSSLERQEHKERDKRSPWHTPWLGKRVKSENKLAEEFSLQLLPSGSAEMQQAFSI